MTGLVIKLRSKEKLLVNGILFQNGVRPARIRVRTPGVSILRMRDAIHPDEAASPVKRLYYVAQLALAGDTTHNEAAAEIVDGLAKLRTILPGSDAATLLLRAETAATRRKFFTVMRSLRKLFELEEALLSRQIDHP